MEIHKSDFVCFVFFCCVFLWAREALESPESLGKPRIPGEDEKAQGKPESLEKARGGLELPPGAPWIFLGLPGPRSLPWLSWLPGPSWLPVGFNKGLFQRLL